MVHYKIALDTLRTAGLKEEGCFKTFCGLDLRHAANEEEYRHIPPCNPECAKLVVNCPTCKAIYEAITKDYVYRLSHIDCAHP